MEKTEFTNTIDGKQFADMLRAGAAELRAGEHEINDLNVFPIPDGDTGSNMLLTLMGGVEALRTESADISEVAKSAANGMLLAARGNSGVILSQLFDGIARGLEGVEAASAERLAYAFGCGVSTAYKAVLKPTEGTILTVARCATENTEGMTADTPTDYMTTYVSEAKKTLERTPDMLPVLKKAGVIDSGGAGLVRILEGMQRVLRGEDSSMVDIPTEEKKEAVIDLDKFTKDSVLTFGYCTELLLRLQSSKTDVDSFPIQIITDFLQSVGDSVAAFKTDSIVKIHVHTMTPDKVLAFCQQYGEFLTIKIENMSLQHNNTVDDSESTEPSEAVVTKKYGVIAVLSGEGIKEMFREIGVDRIVDGGQSMNPSSEDFLHAFADVHAEHIFVLPNNGNVIMAAEQAGKMYTRAEIHVLPSKTIGEGYAALSMMNPDEPDVEAIKEEMLDAMSGVATAEVSHCIRNVEMDGMALHIGDYIGVCSKKLMAASASRTEAVCKTVENIGMSDYEACIIIRGTDANMDEAESLAEQMRESYRGKEVYLIDGGQDVYDYILILQ